MNPVILGIDTSCYTTSVAAVALNSGAIVSLRTPLSVDMGQRGLQQSDAVFQHVKALPDLLARLMEAIGDAQIIAIGASVTPRDNGQSYMPVFVVGANAARNIAKVLRVPMMPCTHQAGHIAAARINSGLCSENHLALHLSGGTTELLRVTGDHIERIGGTNDISAGQFVDRVGVALNMSFPAGPQLERLANTTEAALSLNASVRGLTCSFSGAESQAQRAIVDGACPAQVALGVYECLVRACAKLIERTTEQTALPDVLIAGGVASSALFRQLLNRRMAKRCSRVNVFWGQPEYSGDNAVGAAMLARKCCVKE